MLPEHACGNGSQQNMDLHHSYSFRLPDNGKGDERSVECVVASLYLIVPVALLFCALAVAAWLWASRSGQFDDLDREARRILHDDPLSPPAPDTLDAPRMDKDANP